MLVIWMILLTPSVIALAAAILCGGWKKVLAWVSLALTVLPLLVSGVGGAILGANGLAWRSGVKLPLGMLYVFGTLALLLLGSALLWERAARMRLVWSALSQCAIAAGTVLVCLAVGWYGLLFAAIWAGSDREVTVDGQRMVAEQSWMDWDYYAYHNSVLRGRELLYSDWEARQERSPQEEPVQEDLNAKDAAARKKVSKALGLDLPDGDVQKNIDTHGGFHNDGKTYIQIRFEDGSAVKARLAEDPDWTALPLPEDLRTLAELINDDQDIRLPTDGELGDGYYWFLDRHSLAEDRRDYRAALERRSFNFAAAFYSIGEETLCFCRLDT